MNEVLKALKERRSCRSYLSGMVPQEKLESIVEAGLCAPSGHGRESTKILVVKNKALRDQLADINARAGNFPEGMDPFYGAPVVLVVLGESTWPTFMNDATLAIGNMLTAAHALGLGACWVHRAKEEIESDLGQETLRRLGIGKEWVGIGNMIVGCPAPDAAAPKAAPRKAGRAYCLD